ncbi:NAD-dependent epimerase/dehydratase family protein [Parabacteroides goldsteinii]|jgi:UDP-glucuronate decarboxylase|uniref:NAD-dependent epimerase/dehydratase family protein n=1 Tax=Parabacteroides goldsteinii TaxID=328812 RepID=UPI002165B181|nr:NAD-dependent epimerase/dehydratase family protein [Parabacteroides goldsteinii]MCS2426222.1 NAD-dependent epimerase/dehydratase family protein [Parabacteroides goldsteinii]
MEKRDLDIILNSSTNWLMYRNKTVLVTGVTGRLGRYIFDVMIDVDLRYNLNMRIIGMARSEEKVLTVFEDELRLPNVDLIYQDINESIMYDSVIDYIFHTAGPAAPVDFKNIPVETLWSHVNGTHNILECARTHETKKVFYVSTVEIYGEWNKEQNILEEDMGILQHLNFRACYPEAKRLCETMFTAYEKEYGIKYCGVRFSHTLGPGILLDDGRAFAEFLDCAFKGKDIHLMSEGSAMRTYTYVADAMNAVFLIMDKGENTFYNVSADENLISIRDLAELIATLSPSGKTKVLFDKSLTDLPYLPFKLAIMDTTKVRDLGWKPQVGLKDMFKWTLESFI